MALKTEDRITRGRPRVIRDWGLPYPIRISEIFWGERFYKHVSKFHPIIQMRFISTDFPGITTESLKDFESVLREALLSATRNIDKVCREYVEKISKIEAVREILLVEAEKINMVWTIIKAAPFEDSLRKPIYTAQLEILRSLEQDIPIDFYILNESEFSSEKNLSDIIPSNARSIWQR